MGLGASAHSFAYSAQGPTGYRWWNPRNWKKYMASAQSGTDFAFGEEIVDGPGLFQERLMLGLRCTKGFDLKEVADFSGIDLKKYLVVAQPVLDNLASDNLLHLQGATIKPTAKGLMLADSIALRLGSVL